MEMKPTRGRPRSEGARLAVIDATVSLLSDVGYDKLTIDAIATRAGVGRQTIYRWWPSKSAIVAEAVRDGRLGIKNFDPEQTTDPLADIQTWFRRNVVAMRDASAAAVIRALSSAAGDDTAEAEAIYAHTTGPGLEALQARLLTAQKLGQIRPATDLAAVSQLLFGALHFQALSRRPPDDDGAAMLDVILRGVATPSS